jgi:bifunctional UDP-N-acetylglucosamine pyrophosphorylase/glucosamine-1-phosphate N-acetyltransferase
MEQLGTGHAVQQAMPLLAGWKGPVLIQYGDAPVLRGQTLAALVSAQAASDSPLAIITANFVDPTGYGRILRDAGGRVLRVVEQKDCTPAERAIIEGNAGIYAVDAEFLGKGVSSLDTKNAQKELYLTDLVEQAARAHSVPTVVADEGEIQGVNDRVQLAEVDRVLRRRLCEEHMRAGVTLRAPEATFIDRGVKIGKDTVISSGVELRGRTTIGAGCVIEAGCVFTHAELGDGVHAKPYTVITESKVGARAQLGPFAHLRPGSELAEDVHVGNFVETKKARLGKGSKANHLAYLGDAVIGEKCNVGAGTITCNYDGFNKDLTILEDGVFIGSDTQLVAPVRVGKDAIVAAGTTVTRDVPAGALALTRVEQVNKEGAAARFREKAKKRKDAGK